MTQQRTFIPGPEQGCPSSDGWAAWWATIRLPLAGRDLQDATASLAAWDDPSGPQGDLGDCPHCAEQVDRLRQLIRQAGAP